jgi:hypothetical protein
MLKTTGSFVASFSKLFHYDISGSGCRAPDVVPRSLTL